MRMRRRRGSAVPGRMMAVDDAASSAAVLVVEDDAAGLGLAVMRSLAEAMGASATAAVAEGAFRLELRFRTANGL